MKSTMNFLFTTLILSCSSLAAYIDCDGVNCSIPITPPSEQAQYPFILEGMGDFVGNSDFTKHSLKHQHLQYSEWEVEANMIYLYNPVCKEGLAADIDYSVVNLDWKQNRFFNETKFKTISLALQGFTHRLDDWLWSGYLSFNFDPEHLNFGNYTTYDLLLWGRYSYWNNLGIHFGLFAETGMKIDRVYPVLGVDWLISEKWRVNLVMPVDMSILYTVNEYFFLDLKARMFDSRHRLESKERLHEGLFTYRNIGMEFGTNFVYGPRLAVNVHVGVTSGGKLVIANHRYEHKHHYKLNSAGYVGGEASVHF